MQTYQAYPYEYERIYKHELKPRKVLALAIALLLTAATLLFSCVEGELQRPIVYDPEVHLIYEWPDGTPPTSGQGFTLQLFPVVNGRTEGEPLTREVSPYSDYSKRIPAGSYSVLAYNADARGVTFVDTDDYSRAAVCALTTDGRVAIDPSLPGTRAATAATPPTLTAADNVYSVWSENITPVYSPYEEVKQEIRVQVHQLAAPVHITIEDKTNLKATRVQGTLNGLVLARRLSGGEADIQQGMGAYAFDETFADSKASTTIPCLGIHNPIDPEGKRYDNLLKLVVVFEDKTIIGETLDISNEIAKHIDDTKVSVELGVEVELRDNSNSSIDAIVTVIDWNESEGSYKFQ